MFVELFRHQQQTRFICFFIVFVIFYLFVGLFLISRSFLYHSKEEQSLQLCFVMSNFDRCIELIKESSRQTTDLILPYNYELVEEVQGEMREISQRLFEVVNRPPTATPASTEATADATTLSTQMDTQDIEMIDGEVDDGTQTTQTQTQQSQEDSTLCMKVYLRLFVWNKRCLLAYHRNRLEQLKKIRWDSGALLPLDVKNNVSPLELEWFLNYSKNLSDYMGRLNAGDGIDLTIHGQTPNNIHIMVRCTADYGQMELDNGQNVILAKDSLYYLPISKCEQLINKGILAQVK